VDPAQRPVTRTQSRLQSNHSDASENRPVTCDSPLTDVPEDSDEGTDIIDHRLYDVDDILAFKYNEQVCYSNVLQVRHTETSHLGRCSLADKMERL
jgi:hypothetical protein